MSTYDDNPDYCFLYRPCSWRWLLYPCLVFSARFQINDGVDLLVESCVIRAMTMSESPVVVEIGNEIWTLFRLRKLKLNARRSFMLLHTRGGKSQF